MDTGKVIVLIYTEFVLRSRKYSIPRLLKSICMNEYYHLVVLEIIELYTAMIIII